MIKISHLYTTVFFIGHFKWAPGTIGSLIALLFCLYLNTLINKIFFVTIFIILFIISIKLISIYSESIKKNDASEIIIDEFLGIYLIIIFYNFFDLINPIVKSFIIFLSFRFFDIFKPFPINLIDSKMKNSFGILIDDILAAIYTIIILFLINEFI